MNILAIDPGTTESGVVFWSGNVIEARQLNNLELLSRLRLADWPCEPDVVAVEMVACYGMAVGKEVFETCVWIGRFQESLDATPFKLIYRRDVKMHLCNSARAKDANIRQALIDKHGIVGTKKAPGKLYGVSGHLWAALAIADYVESNPIFALPYGVKYVPKV